jgi:hypothetical protein
MKLNGFLGNQKYLTHCNNYILESIKETAFNSILRWKKINKLQVSRRFF